MQLSAVKASDVSDKIFKASQSGDSSLDSLLTFTQNDCAVSDLLKFRNGIVVVAADTTVCVMPAEDDATPGVILDKPLTEDRAKSTLKQLSGNAHATLTGVSCMLLKRISSDGRLDVGANVFPTFCARSNVIFKPLTDTLIDAYVATGLPLDKAGAYGIQHDVGLAGGEFDLIERLDGSFLNVMGFPLGQFAKEAKAALPPQGVGKLAEAATG